MAKSVSDGIQVLLSWLAPTGGELEKRRAHRHTIKQGLSGEFSGFNDLLLMGSHERGTAIRIKSDMDYFAKLGKADVMWGGGRVNSSTTLDRVKRALKARFSSTDIWIDGPAVVVGFGQGMGAVDVVPSVWVGTTETSPQYPLFDIPDGQGGWIRTSPQRHTKYLRDENERSGSKLFRTIQLLKAWKYARSPKVPIQGFHLELLVAAEGICVGPRAYQNILLDAFRLIRDRAGAALIDPLGISGRVPATATETQRTSLVDHARHAVDKATSAIEAEVAGRVDEAFYYWNLVFNQQFPAR